MRPPKVAGQIVDLSLANGASEGDDVDGSRAGCTQRRGCGRDGRTRGVPVVDEADRMGRPGAVPADERVAHVLPPLDQAQPCLSVDRPRASEEGDRIEGPARGELSREIGGGLMASLEA